MLKKFGVVAVGVTAGLLAVAPAALAHDSGGQFNQNCTAKPGPNGSTSSNGQCNTTGQHVGENNTFTVNGVALPFPSL